MGGPSSDPIRCVNQNSQKKYPSRGICPRGSRKEKNPSRVSVIVVRIGVTSWLMVSLFTSMSAFVEDALALELPLSKSYIFPTP
jgi:hypothetical protein